MADSILLSTSSLLEMLLFSIEALISSYLITPNIEVRTSFQAKKLSYSPSFNNQRL